MNKRQHFKINLNVKLLVKLRDQINSKQLISIQKQYKPRKHEQQSAWDMICAIMDRLDDECYYLNKKELHKEETREAFSFLDFLNHSAVMIDCIKELSRIFDAAFDDYEKTLNCFTEKGINGKGTDKQYFEYLRSICAVHPIYTDRHEEYQGAGAIECCPFVVWQRDLYNENSGDLTAVIYNSQTKEYCKRLSINVSEVFSFVKACFEYTRQIVQKVKQYQKDKVNKYRQEHINLPEESDSYGSYLENLKNETTKRQDYLSDNLNYACQLEELRLTDERNIQKFSLYKNAIKYALTFVHKQLQDMRNKKYKYNGMKYCKENIETSLFHEILYLDGVTCSVPGYIYSVGKIVVFLNPESRNIWLAESEYSKMLPFIKQYVYVSEEEGYFERYVLMEVAFYLNKLENICLMNVNLPNSLDFREKLLSENELLTLQSNFQKA
jgi:hypothetical protein